MSQILKYSVCFVVSLFLLSCNNEELGGDNNASLNRVKENLQLNKFSNVNISENVQVNWESITETQKGNFKISEISASEKIGSTLESKFLENHLKYQIVTIESGGQLYSYFVEVFTNKGSDIYPETITKLNGFAGTLNVFLLNGENLGSVAIYKGKATDISENNTLNVLTACINAFMDKSYDTNKMPQCGGNYTVFIDQTISRFDVWTVGDKIVAINYVGTTTTRTTSIMAFPCDGLYGKNDILNQRLESYNYKDGNGGGNNPGISLMPPPPEIPVSDIIKFLSCLNTSANANLTVFAERINILDRNVGHAFISISQGNNIMVFGFYPQNGNIKSVSGPGIMGENGGHYYNVSAKMEISGQKLQQIINLSQKYQNSTYDLSFNNCSDFAKEVLEITGVLTTGFIDTPNTVADILLKLPNHTSNANYAPKTKRTCL